MLLQLTTLFSIASFHFIEKIVYQVIPENCAKLRLSNNHPLPYTACSKIKILLFYKCITARHVRYNVRTINHNITI